jgi:hypothetical protein
MNCGFAENSRCDDVLNRLKADDVKMPETSTAGKRWHLRRWAISIAIGLSLHAVAAVFVLLR